MVAHDGWVLRYVGASWDQLMPTSFLRSFRKVVTLLFLLLTVVVIMVVVFLHSLASWLGLRDGKNAARLQ